jgi:hypothetical protein
VFDGPVIRMLGQYSLKPLVPLRAQRGTLGLADGIGIGQQLEVLVVQVHGLSSRRKGD